MAIPRAQRNWPRPLVWGQILATYSRTDARDELRGTGFPQMPPNKALARGRPGPTFDQVYNLAQRARARGRPRGLGPEDRIALWNYNRRVPQRLTQTFVAMGRGIYWTKMGMIVYSEGLDSVILKDFDYVTRDPHSVVEAARDLEEQFSKLNVAKYPAEGRMTLLAQVPIFYGRGFRTRDEALAFQRRWWNRA